jgi:peptidyl-prolyl cis-trans isomerase SurA
VKRSNSFRTAVGLGLIVVAFVLNFTGCAPKRQDSVVASIGTTPITLTDFEKMYVRSNGGTVVGDTVTQDDRERFLDLMIKYRLKLTDAYRRGLDKQPDVRNEINQYRGSLAASYLTDRELVQPNVRKLFNHSREEIRASHILLSIRPDAKSDDSAAVYKKAMEIIAEAKAGRDFSQLAVNNSQDPGVQQNKGDLYYFTTGRMVPEFEDAAYELKIGEVTSVPLKTRFGLHILKVTDRKPSVGEMQASHIMIGFPRQQPTPEDTAAAYAKILAVQDSLKMGIPFDQLAMRHSVDGGSSGRGGDLGWFSRAHWPQPFDEAAFLLTPGKISPIVRTAYGYHIILCTGTRPPKTFEESKQEIQNTYQQQRFQTDYAAYTGKLRNEVRFVRNDSIVTMFMHAFDSTKTIRDSGWAETLPRELARAPMFSTFGRPISVDSVIVLIKTHVEWSTNSLHPTSLKSIVDKLAEQILFTAKSDLLEQQDPEFAGLLHEYRDGILLYQAEQDQVWNKVTASDSLLHIYFNQHREKFVFPDRVKFTEIRTASDVNSQTVAQMLASGKSMEQIVKDDSIRMAVKTSYQTNFAKGKTDLSKPATLPLSAAVAVLQKESATRLMIAVYADTSVSKSKNETLAKKRLNVVKELLSKRYGVETSRIIAETRNANFAAAKKKDTAGVLQRLDIQVLGLQPLVIAALESGLAAPAADERARSVDSVAVGGYSTPFIRKGIHSIVRKDGVEPARQKAFEECGAELSSAFQEFESKRLEAEWLNSIKQYAPVVEHKELLKNAFAKNP